MGKTFCFMEFIATLSRGYNHIHPGYNYIPTYLYCYTHYNYFHKFINYYKRALNPKAVEDILNIITKKKKKVVKTTCGHLCMLYHSGSQQV